MACESLDDLFTCWRIGDLAIVRRLVEISWVTSQSDASVRFGNGSGYGKLVSIFTILLVTGL
jgi:hypothetical protein